jgi:hypothetical protein
MTRLTIFSVATDRYLEFWLELLRSAEKFLDKDLIVQWILFTNREKDIPFSVIDHLGTNLVTVRFESSPWPMPTLLRYELLASAAKIIEGEIIMHLDADMLFASSLSKDDLHQAMGNQKVALVKHPGYFRPQKLALIKFYIRNPTYIFRDLKSQILNGGIGSWEKNHDSLAFVNRKDRSIYVCGGAWFGKRESIIDLCRLLSERIQKDLSKNIIAKFHDESHLNWFAVNHEVSTLSPIFCFELSYPQLISLTPKIIAVDKGNGSNWERQ